MDNFWDSVGTITAEPQPQQQSDNFWDSVQPIGNEVADELVNDTADVPTLQQAVETGYWRGGVRLTPDERTGAAKRLIEKTIADGEAKKTYERSRAVLDLPVVRDARDLVYGAKAVSAGNRIDEPDAAPEDFMEVAKYLVDQERLAKQAEERGILGTAARIAGDMPGIIAAFGGSGALAKGVAGAVGKKVASKTLAGAAGEVARAAHPAMAPFVARKAMQYAAPQGTGDPAAPVEEGDDLPKAVAKGLASQALENISERTGEAIAPFTKPVTNAIAEKILPGVVKRLAGTQTPLKTAVSQALKEAHFDGVPAELMEERVSEILQGATGLEEGYGVTGQLASGQVGPALKQMAGEALGIAAVPGAQAVLNTAAGAVEKRGQLKDLQKQRQTAQDERAQRKFDEARELMLAQAEVTRAAKESPLGALSQPIEMRGVPGTPIEKAVEYERKAGKLGEQETAIYRDFYSNPGTAVIWATENPEKAVKLIQGRRYSTAAFQKADPDLPSLSGGEGDANVRRAWFNAVRNMQESSPQLRELYTRTVKGELQPSDELKLTQDWQLLEAGIPVPPSPFVEAMPSQFGTYVRLKKGQSNVQTQTSQQPDPGVSVEVPAPVGGQVDVVPRPEEVAPTAGDRVETIAPRPEDILDPVSEPIPEPPKKRRFGQKKEKPNATTAPPASTAPNSPVDDVQAELPQANEVITGVPQPEREVSVGLEPVAEQPPPNATVPTKRRLGERVPKPADDVPNSATDLIGHTQPREEVIQTSTTAGAEPVVTPPQAQTTREEAAPAVLREQEAARYDIEQAGIKLKRTPKGWSVTGIPQEIGDGLKEEYKGKRTKSGYVFKRDPTEGLRDAARTIKEETELDVAEAARGRVKTRIGYMPAEQAQSYEEERADRLKAARQQIEERNSGVDELISQFVSKERRGKFKLKLLNSAERSDPDTIKSFDEMVQYAQDHPELGLPQDEDGLFNLLTRESFTIDEKAIEDEIDSDLAAELAQSIQDAEDAGGDGFSWETGEWETSKQPQQTAIPGLESEVARQERSEQAERQAEKSKAQFTNTGGKESQTTLFGKEGMPGQMNLFADKGVPEDMVSKEQRKPSTPSGAGYSPSKPIERMENPAESGSASGVIAKEMAKPKVDEITERRLSVKPVPMPELFELAKEWLGKPPKLKQLPRSAGLFKGAEGIGPMDIIISRTTARDPHMLSQTMAHEIGHLIDFLPDNTLKRGNLLGRLHTLKGFMQGTIPILDKKAAARLRAAAKKAAGKNATKEQVNEQYRKMLKSRGILTQGEVRDELLELTRWWSGDWEGASAGYKAYRESAKELYAEALSVFLNSPGTLEQRAPNFYRELMQHLDKKPDVLRDYLAVQELLSGTPEKLAESRTERVTAMFETADQKLKAIREANKARRVNVVEAVQQYLLDTHAPVMRRAKSALTKNKVNQQALAAKYAMDELNYTENDNHRMLRRVQREVWAPLQEQDITRDDIGEYMLMRRIVNERNEIANPLGFEPLSANVQMEAMKNRLGDKRFAKLEEGMRKYHDIIFESAETAVKDGVYSQTNFDEKIEPNKDNYATFAVIKYLDLHVPAGIFQQVGTFSEVGNPFDFTLMKMVTLNRLNALNRAKNTIRDLLQSDFANEITREPKGAPQPGFADITILEDGKPVEYRVPKPIASSLMKHDVGALASVGNFLHSKLYQVFHPLYVAWNPGFIAANPFRDFWRTYRNLASIGAGDKKKISMGDVIKAYWKALPTAKKRASGIADETIDRMMDEKALSVPFVAANIEDGEGEFEYLLKQHGLTKEPTPNAAMRTFKKFTDAMEWLGTYQETASKVAADILLTERGYSPQERAYIVRKYAGTPDYKQKALLTPVTNSVWMYSKVRWVGLQSDAEIATNPKTRAAWWWRQILWTALPTTLSKAIAYGLLASALGDDDDDALPAIDKDIYDLIPEYYLDNYTVIPLGTTNDDGKEKAVFMSLPLDDTSRMLKSLTSKAIDLVAAPTGAARKEAGDKSVELMDEVWSSSIGEVNPGINIANKWQQYARGQNPYDGYQDRQIIPRAEFEAGGWYAGSKMVEWTFDQTGALSTIFHGTKGAVDDKNLEVATKALPFMSRLLRVSDRGVDEQRWADIENEEQEAARLKLQLGKDVNKRTKELFTLRRIGAHHELSVDEETKKFRLNEWYNDVYLPVTKQIKNAEESGRSQEAEKGRESLRKSAKELDENVKVKDAAALRAMRQNELDTIAGKGAPQLQPGESGQKHIQDLRAFGKKQRESMTKLRRFGQKSATP